MKKWLYSILIVLLAATHLTAQYTVAVNNGYGSGQYRGSGRSIHIWAEAFPQNMVFDRWVGDTSVLVDPTAWHTRIISKRKTTDLTATFKSAPAWTPTTAVINGSEYRYYFPPNIRGVVFRFHGSGGSASTFFSRVEDRNSANNFVAAGFAVVALDSKNRIDKQWDNTNNPPNNLDIINVQGLINLFIAQGMMTAATPVFSTGMSNGGAFSPRVAYALQFTAAAIYCVRGGTYINITNVPTIWNVAQNDSNEQVGPSGNADSYTLYRILLGRGIRAEHNVHLPSPLYPQRFARIPGISLADSQIIFDALKNNNFLDRENNLRQSPTTSNWQNTIPIAYTPFLQPIGSQLDVVWSDHEYFSDNDGRTIAFFNAQLP